MQRHCRKKSRDGQSALSQGSGNENREILNFPLHIFHFFPGENSSESQSSGIRSQAAMLAVRLAAMFFSRLKIENVK
jgi:hypothetical protein